MRVKQAAMTESCGPLLISSHYIDNTFKCKRCVANQFKTVDSSFHCLKCPRLNIILCIYLLLTDYLMGSDLAILFKSQRFLNLFSRNFITLRNCMLIVLI